MDLGFVSLNTPRDIAPGALGQELESRGFESIWVGEHPQIPMSAQDQFPAGLLAAQKRMWDPLLSLLVAAQATTNLRIGTAVALPLERELFTFAKEVATLDQMSRGRLLLGVGVGLRAELEVSRSIGWSDRYRALGDMVAALDSLWSDDEPEYHGEFNDFGPVWSYPKPHQRPRPPLLAATTGPKATRDCRAWADGWLPGDAAFKDVSSALADFRRDSRGGRARSGDARSHDHGLGRAHAGRAGELPGTWIQPDVVGGGRRDAHDPRRRCRFSTGMRDGR